VTIPAAGTAEVVAEVVVVGAGAAGAASAYHLARLGHAVRLLDQASCFPRPKPCGGGMAASMQSLFPFDLSPVVDAVINQVRFTWCLEDSVTAELPGDAPFWIVRRSVLDAFLVEQARSAGASFEPGVAVQSLQRQGDRWQLRALGPGGQALEFQSQAVVIADGSGSQLAARHGLGPARPHFAETMAVEVDAEVAEPGTAHFEFGLVHHGFCWAFPRHRGFSIGVGTFIGRDPADANQVLSKLLPSLGLAADGGERRAGKLRIWDGHYPLHGRGENTGLVAVGDAASLCDPFLAEGIRPALISGCRAAEAIDAWLAGDGTALAGYSSYMRAEWGESMAWGKRIAQLFYRVPRVGYQLGVKRPTAPQRIAQILSGEMGYGDIAQRVIRRLLFQG
jgi:geranylgeranyl reductase family protein